MLTNMQKRPPLANLFAYANEDPAALAAVESRLRQSGRYPAIWRPQPGWVAASAVLPGSVADDDEVRSSGLAYAEGRDSMLGSGPKRTEGIRRLDDSLRQGSGSLAAWPGDFGFLKFLAPGSAIAVRSCAGLVPFYFWTGANSVAISTQIGALLTFAGCARRLQPVTTAVWTLGLQGLLSNRTHIEGIRALMPGEAVALSLDRGRTSERISRYWMPQPGRARWPSDSTVKEHQHRLREHLVQRLTSDLDPEQGNLLTLSGGVDSSSLLALASKVVRVPVMTWSLLPTVAAAQYERERSYVEPLRQWAGVERYWEGNVTDDSMARLVAGAPPIPYPVLHPALLSLGGLAREATVRVMFGGEFADEICGERVSTPDWAAGTSFAQLLTHPARWPYGRSAPARWAKARLLGLVGRPYLDHQARLPDYCPEKLQTEYRELLRTIRNKVASFPAAHRYLMTRHQLIDLAPQNWEACSYYGVRRSLPFLSREMIELNLECHPSELIGPGVKRLLRGALDSVVPHKNLYRPDKGSFGPEWGMAKLPLDDLALDKDEVWGGLDEIVSPEWRRQSVQRGWVDSSEKIPLLHLKRLRRALEV